MISSSSSSNSVSSSSLSCCCCSSFFFFLLHHLFLFFSLSAFLFLLLLLLLLVSVFMTFFVFLLLITNSVLSLDLLVLLSTLRSFFFWSKLGLLLGLLSLFLVFLFSANACSVLYKSGCSLLITFKFYCLLACFVLQPVCFLATFSTPTTLALNLAYSSLIPQPASQTQHHYLPAFLSTRVFKCCRGKQFKNMITFWWSEVVWGMLLTRFGSVLFLSILLSQNMLVIRVLCMHEYMNWWQDAWRKLMCLSIYRFIHLFMHPLMYPSTSHPRFFSHLLICVCVCKNSVEKSSRKTGYQHLQTATLRH